MTVRDPVFADDRWYPSTGPAVTRAIDGYLSGDGARAAIGIVAPHAGIFYSGRVAGAIYGAIRVPDRVIVLAVNHRGIGARQAIIASGAWDIPTGRVPIDPEAAATLMRHAPALEDDATAHSLEHSLELQLPFLWARNPNVTIVPVCLGRIGPSAIDALGRAVASTIQELDGETLIVASSDLNHQEPQSVSRVKDRLAIERVLALDPTGLVQTVRQERITMCGVIPTAVMLRAALQLGATSAELIKYEDSSVSSGDKSHVVGYAGLLIAA